MSLILVTGGKGFLGCHLVTRLTEKKEEVRIFAHALPKEGVRKDENGNNIVCGDIRDLKAVEKAVQGVDIVIHLVSNFRKGGSDKKEAYSINVEGTENILNASIKYGVKQLIYCSTIGVHGSVKEIPANEETPFNPGDLYQETKLIAEKRVWDFYKETNLPVTVIRPISLIGPGDLRMLKLFRSIKKKRFVMIGKGDKFFQPAYIDDVVSGFLLCLENEKAIGEVFIIGGDEYLPLEDLVQLIAKELNVTVPNIKIPLAPILIMAYMCERICAPLRIDPPLHRRRVSFFQNNRAFSVEKAKRILGFKPIVSLREGIQRTILWYENNGWL
ncbi:MAG: NAD-dependent epimerase/dehydratase family protein [Planctomycetota bacterium]|jgi:nucleoside-diphosphate-sugar epimerase